MRVKQKEEQREEQKEEQRGLSYNNDRSDET